MGGGRGGTGPRRRSQGEVPGLGGSAGPRTDVRGAAQVPGLKSWVMIGRDRSGGGAACSGKWTEVHAAAVLPIIGMDRSGALLRSQD